MNKLLVLIALFSLLISVRALSEGEILALEHLLTEFPVLASLTPPWSSNVSEACEGSGFYGITCSKDRAHVTELYVSHFFVLDSYDNASRFRSPIQH